MIEFFSLLHNIKIEKKIYKTSILYKLVVVNILKKYTTTKKRIKNLE